MTFTFCESRIFLNVAVYRRPKGIWNFDKPAWCCALDQNAKRAGVGLEGRAEFLFMETGVRRRLSTKDKDPMIMRFSQVKLFFVLFISSICFRMGTYFLWVYALPTLFATIRGRGNQYSLGSRTASAVFTCCRRTKIILWQEISMDR